MDRQANKSDTVLETQKKLNAMGYELAQDGIFGKDTQTAMRDFQRSIRLKADGVFGAETEAAINACLWRIAAGEPKTAHFSINMFVSPDDETAVRRGIPAIYWDNLLELMNRMEQVQAAVKQPLVIRSGYRSLAYNRQVGGSAGSQHLCGKAADIYVKDYVVSCCALARMIYDDAGLRGLFGGMGLGSVKNLHLDIREKTDPLKPTLWWYAIKSWKAWSRI